MHPCANHVSPSKAPAVKFEQDGQQDNDFSGQSHVLGENLPWELADTYALVLAAARIDYRFRRSGWGWSLEVAAAEADQAVEEIDRFQRENPPHQEVAEPRTTVKTLSGVLVALVLMAFHLVTTHEGAHEQFIVQAGADAQRILAGEYWRTITALTLHGDSRHLAGNMLAIAVFGTLLCKRVGTGAAWLLIVLAGAGGNLINAWMHQTGHLSIGASTAVFGAVGLLGGVRLPHGMLKSSLGQSFSWLAMTRTWLLPLGAALGLLAMLGSDVQTDLGAHLFGCLCGLFLGAGYGLRFPNLLDEGPQLLLLLLAILLVMGSWWRIGTH